MTWNARALLPRNLGKRRKKLSHLEANIRNVTLVALQEVHGTEKYEQSYLDSARIGTLLSLLVQTVERVALS